jgi:hypothetical protein
MALGTTIVARGAHRSDMARGSGGCGDDDGTCAVR